MVLHDQKREIDLYLNLLKNTLCYLFWEESESPVGLYGGSRRFKIFGGHLIVNFLRKFNLKLKKVLSLTVLNEKQGKIGQLKHTP